MIYWILGVVIWFLTGYVGRIIFKRYVISRFGSELFDFKTNLISWFWVIYGPMSLIVIIVALIIADATYMKEYKDEK